MTLILLVLTYVAFPIYPGIALLTGSAAVWSAKRWTAEGVDAIETVFFWGALIGCLTVWLR